jgi:hypothetical protein
MSHEAAKKIMDLVIRQGAEQNQVLLDIQPICSQEDFRRYRRMIARSMGSMLLDVMNPIIQEYPDLKPPELD